ncbi:Ppx/GppA phosphatase family-domain-containing protein [Microdochium bolleyi]|uniref:Ppx/GppA phosphatase family-domain-containing protein n=1 Tax=Microdochium bolleyi TaxID=196109 RepID=A0A136J438_9PEZI|nr:Ppx/GppA phosphatase family-domain-containing protein [Microdochium bolleyi]
MELITLDNFAAKMPVWDPSLASHRYALVDMGRSVLPDIRRLANNGIRFSVSDLTPPQARLLRCLYRERAAISLFDALNTTPPGQPLRFPDEVISHVAKVLSRFKAIALGFGVPIEHISVFATEAMRKANNAATMLEAIRAESGLQVQVIAPEVETLFGAMGARSAYGQVDGLFLDLGGGSVQMSYIDTRLDDYELKAAQSGKSLPFGAAKLINILRSEDGEAHVLARNELRDGMLRAFADLRREYPSLADIQTSGERGIDLYLCGGGFRGYGSMLMHTDPIHPYPIPTIGGYTVDGERFRNVSALKTANETYDGKIFGMSKRRRSQFPAIAEVIEALVKAIPAIRTVTFCSGGNREGALLMRLPRVMRESDPLTVLSDEQDEVSREVADAILDILSAAMPPSIRQSVPTILSLGVARLFINNMWTRQGETDEANAASELRYSLTNESNCPGLTHLARSVLSLTASARWSPQQAPVDAALHHGLVTLANKAHEETAFWAAYLGVIASLVCTVLPVAPLDTSKLGSTINVNATESDPEGSGGLSVLRLDLQLSGMLAQTLGDDTVLEPFKQLNKQKAGLPKHRKIEVVLRSV